MGQQHSDHSKKRKKKCFMQAEKQMSIYIVHYKQPIESIYCIAF